MVSRKSEILDELFEIIETRKQGDAEASYTAKLFSKGPATIGRKLNEESVEALIAAAKETAPAQTIRVEQGPIKIVTDSDQPPYKM